jgi:hypothetical protein
VKCGSGGCARRDLVGGWSAVVLWCLPTALILVGIFVPAARAALWIPSFTIMGVACLVNARGCGRLHCHITGPVFLLGAIASVLDALAVVSIDWKLVIAATAIGTVIAYALEWTRGKYIETSVPSSGE